LISKYNEKEYAEYIYKHGFLTNHRPYELKLLVKYFKSLGHKPKARKDMLYDFCEKYIDKFSKAKYFKIINTALSYGGKKHNNLIVIENINITKEELYCITEQPIEHNLKKVMFTLLVQNKINKAKCMISFGKSSEYNFFGGTNLKYKEIKEIAKLPVSFNVNSAIHSLNDINLIEIKTRGKIDLSFIYKIAKSDDIKIIITKFDDIGWYFDYYCSENKIIKCEVCGKFVKATNNKIKYCKECAVEIKQQQDRIADQKYREKIKNEKIENI